MCLHRPIRLCCRSIDMGSLFNYDLKKHGWPDDLPPQFYAGEYCMLNIVLFNRLCFCIHTLQKCRRQHQPLLLPIHVSMPSLPHIPLLRSMNTLRWMNQYWKPQRHGKTFYIQNTGMISSRQWKRLCVQHREALRKINGCSRDKK